MPILLSGPAEFSVASPVAVNSPDYVAQLSEIKGWQQDISDEEEKNGSLLGRRRRAALE